MVSAESSASNESEDKMTKIFCRTLKLDCESSLRYMMSLVLGNMILDHHEELLRSLIANAKAYHIQAFKDMQAIAKDKEGIHHTLYSDCDYHCKLSCLLLVTSNQYQLTSSTNASKL